MLTDEEIDEIRDDGPYGCLGAGSFNDICAQAKEANRLRSQADYWSKVRAEHVTHTLDAEDRYSALLRRLEVIAKECATEASIDPLRDESPWLLVEQKLRALIEERG